MLKAIHRMQRDERGFTLVELLIVIAIIAILAAIAIPQFSEYRKRGFHAAVKSDTKNSVNTCAAALANDPNANNCGTLTVSSGVSCSFSISNGTITGSCNHAQGGSCNYNGTEISCTAP